MIDLHVFQGLKGLMKVEVFSSELPQLGKVHLKVKQELFSIFYELVKEGCLREIGSISEKEIKMLLHALSSLSI